MAPLFSLKYRIALSIFLLEGLMMAFVLWQVISQSNNTISRQIEAQEQVSLELMAGLSRMSLLTEDYADMQPYFDNMMRDPRVERAMLANARGRIVAGTQVSDFGKNLDNLQPDENSYFRERIIQNASGLLGKLVIEFSDKSLVSAQNHARNLGLTIAISGMTAIAIIGLLMGWALTHRLDQLKNAAISMAQGDLNVRTNLKGQDEIALLSRSFDAMAERLAADQIFLTRANNELESKVLARTAELESALKNLQIAQNEIIHHEKLASLGSLVAGMAHELNTPIGNGVTVSSSIYDRTDEFKQLIREDKLRKSALEEYTRFMSDSSGLLLKNLAKAAELIASFKQVSVDQSSENRRPFNLKDTIQVVIQMLTPVLKKLPHTVEVKIDEQIEMDSYPGPLEQIITNLINNAMTHAFVIEKPGKLQIFASLQGNSEVLIKVSDDGIGISAENLPKIFDPFFTTAMGKGGSGLGLHISHNLISGVLGGKIEVESQPGIGTTFKLLLPLIAPAKSGNA